MATSQGKTVDSPNLHISKLNPDGFYTTEDVAALLHVKTERVTEWVQLGLQCLPLSEHSNAKRLFEGFELIRFLRAWGMAMRILALMKANADEKTEPPPAG